MVMTPNICCRLREDNQEHGEKGAGSKGERDQITWWHSIFGLKEMASKELILELANLRCE